MGYLLYVAHDAENLQFFLWLQDYTKRFHSISKEQQALSPPWDEDAVLSNLASDLKNFERQPPQMTQFKFNFDSNSLSQDSAADFQSFISGSNNSNAVPTVEYANAQTGLKWQSCKLTAATKEVSLLTMLVTIQPFRSEINRIISHYLAPGAPRELNMSHKNRTACVRHPIIHQPGSCL